jgi:hypothetical protein
MIRGVTAVSPITVAIFAGPNRLPIEAVAEADAGVQGELGATLKIKFKIDKTCFKPFSSCNVSLENYFRLSSTAIL